MDSKARFKALQQQVGLQLAKNAESGAGAILAAGEPLPREDDEYPSPAPKGRRPTWPNGSDGELPPKSPRPTMESKPPEPRTSPGLSGSSTEPNLMPPLQRGVQARRGLSAPLDVGPLRTPIAELIFEESQNDVAAKRASFGEHAFGRYLGMAERCLVCDKKIIPLLKDASQCQYCGLCVHDDCWNKVFPSTVDANGVVGIRTMAPFELCHGSRPGSGQSGQPFTKSSLLLVKQRFDLEPYSPALSDNLYSKLIKNYTDYLTSVAKVLRDRQVKPLTVNELITGFTRILIGSIKRLEEETKEPVSNWQIYYEKFKTVFYDYEYFADARVDVTKVAQSDMADEFTMEDSRLFCSIPASEFYGVAFGKKDKHDRAPNIMAFIARFNKVSTFVMSEILQRDNPKERAAVITYFIEVTACCQLARNFNAMKAILSGLHAAPVYRLKKSWALVVKEKKHRLEEMNRLVSEDANYERYREALAQARLPCVPFLGVFLTDLTYIDVAFANQPEVCQQKTDEVVATIRTYQSRPVIYDPIFAIHTNLLTLKAMYTDDKVLYEMSLEREPKELQVQQKTEATPLKLQDLLNLSAEDLARMSSERLLEIQQECEGHIARLQAELRDDPSRLPESDQLSKLEQLVLVVSGITGRPSIQSAPDTLDRVRRPSAPELPLIELDSPSLNEVSRKRSGSLAAIEIEPPKPPAAPRGHRRSHSVMPTTDNTNRRAGPAVPPNKPKLHFQQDFIVPEGVQNWATATDETQNNNQQNQVPVSGVGRGYGSPLEPVLRSGPLPRLETSGEDGVDSEDGVGMAPLKRSVSAITPPVNYASTGAILRKPPVAPPRPLRALGNAGVNSSQQTGSLISPSTSPSIGSAPLMGTSPPFGPTSSPTINRSSELGKMSSMAKYSSGSGQQLQGEETTSPASTIQRSSTLPAKPAGAPLRTRSLKPNSTSPVVVGSPRSVQTQIPRGLSSEGVEEGTGLGLGQGGGGGGPNLQRGMGRKEKERMWYLLHELQGKVRQLEGLAGGGREAEVLGGAIASDFEAAYELFNM